MTIGSSYFRPEIDRMQGYVPGEQPKVENLIKLNTNENPYPPAPGVADFLKHLDAALLRRYPNPSSDALRDELAKLHRLKRENIIVGNGSDDILTMLFRSFTDPVRSLGMLHPSYSLYAELAAMQGAEVRYIELNDRFELPEDFIEQASGTNLFLMTRPNSPTGSTYPLESMREFARRYQGIVVIDEAYAEFADDHCLDLIREFSNVVVCRTMSKSYGLAGLRLGYAFGPEKIIEGMFKVKDSYNVDRIAQGAALEAVRDQAYLSETVGRIRASRKMLTERFRALGFDVVEPHGNFLFAAPPQRNGYEYFTYLRGYNVLVRYFSDPRTQDYVRVTVGSEFENARLLELTESFAQSSPTENKKK